MWKTTRGNIKSDTTKKRNVRKKKHRTQSNGFVFSPEADTVRTAFRLRVTPVCVYTSILRCDGQSQRKTDPATTRVSGVKVFHLKHFLLLLLLLLSIGVTSSSRAALRGRRSVLRCLTDRFPCGPCRLQAYCCCPCTLGLSLLSIRKQANEIETGLGGEPTTVV